jgi:hypothetical protein
VFTYVHIKCRQGKRYFRVSLDFRIVCVSLKSTEETWEMVYSSLR